MAQKMLNVKEVSNLLGLGINQTRKLVNSDCFPKIKIGRRILIPENEYEEWVKKYCYSRKQL